MKLFLVVCCLLLGSVLDVQADFIHNLQAPITQCAVELKIADVSVLITHEKKNLQVVGAKLDEPECKCLCQCVFQKIGAVDKNGKWNAVGAKKLYSRKAEVEAVYTKCVAANKDQDICLQTTNIVKCAIGLN